MLGAKAALAIRVDALGEDGSFELGAAHKAKLESRMKLLEEGNFRRISGTGKAKAKFENYHGVSEIKEFPYPATADNTMASSSKSKHFDEIKKEEEDMEEDVKAELTPKQLKKMLKKEKKILESNEIKTEIKEEEPEAEVEHKKKKKKRKSESEETTTDTPGETEEVNTEKKEKKKKKSKEVVEAEYE